MRPAEVIHDDEVVFDAAVRVPFDPIEDLHDRTDIDAYTRFLEDFARDRRLQRLTKLYGAAGQAPLAFERRMPAFDEQNSGVVEDNRADAHNRSGWMNPPVLTHRIARRVR
jgi:hypothetical protein